MDMTLHRVSTDDNVSDIFTKGLGREAFNKHKDGLTVVRVSDLEYLD